MNTNASLRPSVRRERHCDASKAAGLWLQVVFGRQPRGASHAGATAPLRSR
jgi:hypothetical protein